MKQYIFGSILSTLFIWNVFYPGQIAAQQKQITLNTATSGTQTHIARDAVYLKPGFLYTAQQSASFSAKIDERMVLPADYLTRTPSVNRTLDVSKTVGTTNGVINVGPAGEATYQIPVSIPSGIGGVQPGISLAYNSQAGNGLLGWGFNIAGLSAIMRMPQTIYSDGTASGIKNTSEDKYALDGNRLVSVSGTYGADGTEYRTETETFSKIYSRSTYGSNGPDRFEVIGKDGMKYFYGNSSGKVIYNDSNGKQSVQCWLLDRVENPVNNQSITYEYEVSDLSTYIKKITYGDNTIEFFYSDRHDIIPVHFDQMNGKITKILRKIAVRESGSIFRQYEFDYFKDTFSRLTQITESNGTGESFNPTIFEWGYYPSGATRGSINVIEMDVPALDNQKEFHELSYFSGDFNGDGKTELVTGYDYWTLENPHILKHTTEEYQYNKLENGKLSFSKENMRECPANSMYRVKSTIGRGGACLTGTGRQDIISAQYNLIEETASMKFYVAENGRLSPYAEHKIKGRAEPTIWNWGDINNDGIDELISIECGGHGRASVGTSNHSTVISVLNKENLTGQKYVIHECDLNLYGIGDLKKLFIADFNGDGMQDLFVLGNSGYIIFQNQGGNNLTQHFSDTKKTTETLFNGKYSSVELGDFNGDGLPDFILNEYCNNKWLLALNNGKGSFEIKALSNFTGYNIIEEEFTDKNDDKDRCFVYDFDGDGKSDLIISDAVYTKGSPLPVITFRSHFVYWFRSTGDGFELVKKTSLDKEDALSKYFVFGDFDGDGYLEMAFYGYDCYGDADKTRKWRMYKPAGFDNKSGRIVAIADGLNNLTNIEYKALTDNAVYSKEYLSNTTTMGEYQIPLNVVYELKTRNGSLYTNSLQYKYSDTRVHNQGKGFLGYKSITITDNILDLRTISEFGYNSTYFYPYLLSQTVENKTESAPDWISVTENSFSEKNISFGGKRIFSYTENAKEYDALKDITVESKKTYDTNGNLTQEIVSFGSDVKTTGDYTYIAAGGNGIPNKVSTVTNNKTYTGKPSFTTKQEFSYNTKGILIKQIDLAHTTDKRVLTEYLDINSLGLPGKIQKKAGISESLITSYQYDSKGRVIKTTDPLGLSVSNNFDSKGRLMSTVDPYGNSTAFRHDSWGDIVRVDNPTGTFETTKTEWTISGDSDSPSNAVYKLITGKTDNPDNISYFDASGRNLRNISVNINNQKVYTDNIYNIRGQLQKVTDPSFSSGNTNGTTYTYDDYGRITRESRYNDIVYTDYAYDKRTTTVTNAAEQKSIKTINAAGDLISSKDSNDTEVLYYYHSSGQPEDIIAGGVKTTMTYDNCGRQLSITDPSAGTKTFEYDTAGNLITEINALNQITTMIYDRYNRLEKKVCPEFTTTYTYNNTTGRLTSKVTSNGTSINYTYDKFGRPESVKDNVVDNKYLQKTYSYNNDYLSSVTYKSQTEQIASENYVYKNGYLYQIKLNNSSVIQQLNTENALGQPLEVKTGNLVRSYGYDLYYKPLTRSVGNIQNFSYNFEPQTGNLKFRKDNNRSKQEDFLYDNLNRLTTYAGNTAVYDPKGNIKQRTDVGAFDYNTSGKPYAVSDATFNSAGLIAQRNQEITYSSFSRPTSISEKLVNNSIIHAATFTYNGLGDRVRMDLSKNGTRTLRRYYISDRYEIDESSTGTKEKLYLGGDAYSAPAVYVKQNGSWQIHYICRDYLGSITHITNSNGTLVQELSYDAWGRLRNPATQGVYAPDSEPDLFLGRGYTGHEHLPMFGLINMNARLYDPLSGRFLSPDPYVQMADFSQNFNRYSYVLNNPLVFTDPTGEYALVDDIIAAVVGGIVNLVVNACQGNLGGHGIWGGIGRGFAAFGAGAVGGWGALYPEAGGWIWGGAVVGATNSWLGGANDIESVAIGAGIGAVAGAAGGAAGQYGGQYLGGAIINGTKITSPVFQGTVTGVIGGATGGYAGGFTAGLIITGDINEANTAGIKGAAFGAPIGGITGATSAYRYAVKNDINPWNGESTTDVYKHNYQYDSRVRMRGLEDPGSHNFPYSFDDAILSTTPILKNNGYKIFQLQGAMNGKNGVFEIGVTNNNVINHRFFRPY